MNERLKKWLCKIKQLEVKLKTFPKIKMYGRLVSSIGLLLEVMDLKLPIGTICIIESKIYNKIVEVEAEVIAFKGKKILLMLLEESKMIAPDLKVFPKINENGEFLTKQLPVGRNLLGRVLDSQGNSVDGLGKISYDYLSSLSPKVVNPLKRKPINQVLDTGIRSINALLTIGLGQKIGIFANAGVGKSVLLEMIVHSVNVDVIVIGLIGERNREIKEFLDAIRDRNNFFRSVVVIAPSNISPILKIQGTLYVATIAEYFRSKNKKVLLIIDSLTRYAMAQREISSSIGEFPISKGYSSSIFSKLPTFIERGGNGIDNEGSISAFYTILTERNEYNDPVSDIARSVLDGHIVLSKSYAESSIFPAIDIGMSISRVMKNLVSEKHYLQSLYFKKLVSYYQRNKDIINVGAYISGSDPILDKSIKLWPKLLNFLQQGIFETSTYLDSCNQLNMLFKTEIL